MGHNQRLVAGPGPSTLGRWFGDAGAEIDLRPGGAMVLRWTDSGPTRGRIVAVEPRTRFSYRRHHCCLTSVADHRTEAIVGVPSGPQRRHPGQVLHRARAARGLHPGRLDRHERFGQ